MEKRGKRGGCVRDMLEGNGRLLVHNCVQRLAAVALPGPTPHLVLRIRGHANQDRPVHAVPWQRWVPCLRQPEMRCEKATDLGLVGHAWRDVTETPSDLPVPGR